MASLAGIPRILVSPRIDILATLGFLATLGITGVPMISATPEIVDRRGALLYCSFRSRESKALRLSKFQDAAATTSAVNR